MKKIVVILLLILPFILIYSISFTGKILAKYTHVSVERIVLLDEQAEEYEEGTVIKLGKGEEYTLRVKVLPELANNKEFTVSILDKNVCELGKEGLVIKALDYGTSEVVLTAKESKVTYSFFIRVTDDDIQSIETNVTELTLGIGREANIETRVLPITTLQENRNLIFTSDDSAIATVNVNGKVTGVAAGETWITIRSDYKEDVFTKVKVTVSADVIDIISFNVSGVYQTSEATLDLKPLTEINVENYTDLTYKVTSNVSNADESRIGEGIVTFNKNGMYKIEVSMKYEDETYTASLMVFFKS